MRADSVVGDAFKDRPSETHSVEQHSGAQALRNVTKLQSRFGTGARTNSPGSSSHADMYANVTYTFCEHNSAAKANVINIIVEFTQPARRPTCMAFADHLPLGAT
jgi:hypothetical protein